MCRFRGRRDGDFERALRLDAAGSHRCVGFRDFGQDARAGVEVARSFVGEPQAAGGAMEEAHAEPGFQGGDSPADQRRGESELAGG